VLTIFHEIFYVYISVTSKAAVSILLSVTALRWLCIDYLGIYCLFSYFM